MACSTLKVGEMGSAAAFRATKSVPATSALSRDVATMTGTKRCVCMCEFSLEFVSTSEVSPRERECTRDQKSLQQEKFISPTVDLFDLGYSINNP